MEVDLVAMYRCGVIVTACRFLAESFWLGPANQVVQIQNIKVI